MEYRHDRLPSDQRFDRVETTLSHLLRWAHPALGGRAYGPALLDGVEARLDVTVSTVIEVGGGAGWLANACLAVRPELAWTFLDVSWPALKAQRSRCPASALRADATAIPLAGGSVEGLLLANEVIADLAVTTAPSGDLVQVGARAFVKELARVLAPGAIACITEFGGDGPPQAVPMIGDLGRQDHIEHSVCFPDLEAYAKDLGFDTARCPLFELLEVDGSVEVLNYEDLRRLQMLAPTTPIFALPRAEFVQRHPWISRFFHFDLPRLDGRRFPDADAQVGAAEAFWALILRQPQG